jgi:CRP-like cAMP-binding protein
MRLFGEQNASFGIGWGFVPGTQRGGPGVEGRSWMNDPIGCHLKKLRARDVISPDEEAAIRAQIGEVRHVPRRHRIVKARQPLTESILLLEGIACRARNLRNGDRQITELHVAGDYMDLHSFTLGRLEHDVLALTDCTIAATPHERLRAITEQFPHLTRVYWFATSLDAAIHREWAVSLGRRTALGRIGHLFCELYLRLELVGLAAGHRYKLPLSQTDLAECLGLTPVHVNRMLRDLRERELVTFRGGEVVIHDWDGLARVAEFDPTYLFLEPRPER